MGWSSGLLGGRGRRREQERQTRLSSSAAWETDASADPCRAGWRDRRKRLENLVDGGQLPRIGIVPITEDSARFYETWVDMGGEDSSVKVASFDDRPRSPCR